MKKNKPLQYLFLVHGLFVLGGSFLGPLYAVFVQHIHGDILSISISWSIFLLSTTICGIIIAQLGDRVKKKKELLIAGYIIRAVVWFFYMFVASIEALIFLQIILGVGEAVGSPAFNALFAQHLDGDEPIKEFSDWTIIGNVTTAIATLLGGFIVKIAGFTILFGLMSFLAFLAAIIAHKKLK